MQTSCGPTAAQDEDRRRSAYAFRLTSAEWRRLLADGSFLRDPDNCIRPRRLMGVPVEIIPDHSLILAR
jgi:hypothetical protein